MAGDASNVRVWETGDVFVFDPAVTFIALTHVPADIDADLHASWLPAGLMPGDPGVGIARDIERTDVNSWQQGRILERTKNPKADITFQTFENNAVYDDLVDPAAVPGVKSRYVAVEVVAEDGYKERRISKAKVRLWVASDDLKQDVEPREITGSLVPVAGLYWTIQEGLPV